MYKYANNQQPDLRAAIDLSKFKPKLDPKYKDFRYTPYATIGAGGIAALIAYLRAKRRGDSLGNRIGQALKWGAGVGALGYLGGQGLDHLYWRPKNLINTIKNHPASKETVPTLAQRVGWIITPRWYDLFSPKFTPTLGLDPKKPEDVTFQRNWVKANRELDNLRVPAVDSQYNSPSMPRLEGFSLADNARQWLLDEATGYNDSVKAYNEGKNTVEPQRPSYVVPADYYESDTGFIEEHPRIRNSAPENLSLPSTFPLDVLPMNIMYDSENRPRGF